MKNKEHALEEQPDGTIIPVETTGNKSASVTGLSVLLEDMKDQLEWFERESKREDVIESIKEYNKGSRDAYLYTIETVKNLMNR